MVRSATEVPAAALSATFNVRDRSGSVPPSSGSAGRSARFGS